MEEPTYVPEIDEALIKAGREALLIKTHLDGGFISENLKMSRFIQTARQHIMIGHAGGLIHDKGLLVSSFLDIDWRSFYAAK